MNLYDETLENLTFHKKTLEDVLWVGTKDYWFSWEEFKKVALKADYDSGFGAAEVATDLVIVGKGFWMTRGEYDGSEWWEYHEYPAKPKEHKLVKYLTVNQSPTGSCGWETLDEINQK